MEESLANDYNLKHFLGGNPIVFNLIIFVFSFELLLFFLMLFCLIQSCFLQEVPADLFYGAVCWLILAKFQSESGKVMNIPIQGLQVSFLLQQESGHLDIYNSSYGENTDRCSSNPNAEEISCLQISLGVNFQITNFQRSSSTCKSGMFFLLILFLLLIFFIL